MSRLSEQKHPAYHLRPNKAVDRFLFIEILRTLQQYVSLKQHIYVGLGGPYIEDFRLLSQYFPEMKLMCIELDMETHKRQKFHQCSRKMRFYPNTFSKFLAEEFPSDRPVAAWIDYTDVNRQCFSEFGDAVRKALPNSLLRITVRAESPVPTKLKLNRFKYPVQVPSKRERDFESVQSDYRGMAVHGSVFRADWFQWDCFSVAAFPQLIARMINAVANAACTHPKTFLPLHSVKYSDGTIMLSVTGIVCLIDQRQELEDHFRRHFEFCSFTHDIIDKIDLPNLTTKERLHLDAVLPTANVDGKECVQHLGYLIEGDGSDGMSRQMLAQFEKYYRLYPYFGKIML